MTGFPIAAICRTSSTLGTVVDRFASAPTAIASHAEAAVLRSLYT
jgi:hypothetical protein